MSRHDVIACSFIAASSATAQGPQPLVIVCMSIVETLLSAVQRQDMVEGVRATASAAASQGQMEWGAARSILRAYERLLDSYTYLSL